MTEKLYYADAYLSEFEAEVLSCEEVEGGFAVKLDRTAFYPEGGGQPSDEGTVNGAKMLRAEEKNGEIIHLCTAGFEPGETVKCALDFKRRFVNMQLHSGEHILSGFINQLTGLDNVGFHMGETAVTIDFNGAVDEETLRKAERLANEKIWQNVEIKVHYPTAEELPSFNYRSKKAIEGQVRLVEVPGADLCACCGTHVKRTGEVGIIKVLYCRNYKGGVRITLQAGERAFEDYCNINTFIRSAGALLKVPPEEVCGAAEKLLKKTDELKALNSELKRKIFISLAEKVEGGKESCFFFVDGSAEEARFFCDLLCEKAKIACVFAAENGDVKYAIGSRTTDVRPLGKLINEKLGGRGGGRPEMVQGSAVTSEEEAEKAFYEALQQ